ncbi:MAG: transposase [Gammaproteobacteria bacterium]|nr:MAG: transposase [Gammaproteobacteria bacterium]
MPRANRVFCKGFIWHITHRCHQKSFLLKFARDRRRWRHWLFEARRRYGLCVLNYIVTSNHIHLLVVDKGNQEISASIQLIAGRTAQEYNRRKKRNGAFWEDRYHATAVQSDHHLIRCLSYIDLNMVRAGVVTHPSEWDISGYHEIQNPFHRKGTIDLKMLCKLTGLSTIEQLQITHNHWIDNAGINSKRDPIWTDNVAVGDEKFLMNLKIQLGGKGMHRQIRSTGEVKSLNETGASYKLPF